MAINFSREGYDSTLFNDFEVAKAPCGPGWFIIGRDPNKYGTFPDGRGRYIQVCGWRTEKRHRHYNRPVKHGWRTKREAKAALAYYAASHAWARVAP